MKYRTLGRTGFQVSEIGLGGEYLEGKPLKQVCNTVDAAMDAGINLLDCFMSNPDIRSDLGTALKGKRDKMYIQGHFRSIWKNGQYGRTMDVKVVQAFFEDLLRRMQTDYIDLGMIHMIDNAQEYEEIFSGPILEYTLELKQKGLIRALGVSCHNPVQALRAAKTGLIDLMLFSVNPAYDVLNENAERPRKLNNRFFDSMQELGGINPVREELYRYCEMHGVGITVMKSLAAGALLSDKTSPFGRAMTVQQCMHYALSRPGVASVLVGMQSPEQVADCVRYETMTPEELDYSFLFAAEPKFSMQGRCMYCNHCLPCAKHINIAQLSKYLDGGVLDVIGCVAQLGNGKHRGADDVFIMDEAAVLGVVGVALGTEAQSGGIVLVGDHLHHPVGGHGVLIQHEGDDLPRPDGGGVHLFYVDEGAHMVSGFHGSRQNGEGADAGQSDADQRHGQKYCQRHQNGADDL